MNKLYCIADKSSENDKAPFDPFYVTDNESINKYGIYEGQPLSDSRFKDKGSMERYAKTQLQPESSFQVQFNKNDDNIELGKIRTLIIPELDLTTKVKVTQTTTYPLSDTQQSQGQLDNIAKTILDYNNSLHNYLNGNKDLSSSSNTAINNAIQNNQVKLTK